MQRIPDSQKLRRWQDFLMSFDCIIEHTAGKDNHIADTLSRMHKYSGIFITEDNFIPYSVDSTSIRPLQEINSNYINLSDHSTTSPSTSNHQCHNIPPHAAINFTHVECDFHKCRGTAETARHNHSCLYRDEEDMQLTSEDDYEVIKTEDKEVSSDEEPLSPIPEELFVKYQAPSTNINLTDGYNNLRIVPSQTQLPFRFTTSSPVPMRNESLDYVIRLWEGTEKPVLTLHSHKPLSNEELAAIIRNATKTVDSQLNTIHPNFQQYCCQQWPDCGYYYCKSHGSSHQMRGRYIRLDDTISSICGHKGYRYLSCSWIGPVLQKEKELQVNQRNSWNQATPSTTPLPVIKTMEEREIRNARIASNTPWNTTASTSPAPQAGPSNYTTAAVTNRFQNRPKKCDIAKPTPINTNLP